MESRTLNSKRNIIAGVLSNCIMPVFALLVRSAIVKYFSVEYVGLVSIFTSVLQVLNVAELGFSAAVIYNLYKPLKENDEVAVRSILAYYRCIYRTIGLIIFVAGMVACLFLKKIAGDTSSISENIYILYILYLLETAIRFILFGYKEALFNALQRLDITKNVYIIIFILKSGLQLLAIVVLHNFYLYAGVIVLSTVCYNVTLNILSKKKFPQYYPDGKIDETTKKSVIEQVMGVAVSRFLGASRGSLNSIVITTFLGLHIAGQYSNYNTIFSTVLGFFLIITKAIQSSIGNSIVSETVKKNHLDFTKMEFLLNFAVTACTVYLISLYQPFMKFWLGSELVFSDSIMILFVLHFYILAMSEVKNAYFAALGYWWKAKWLFIIETIMNVVLIPTLGKFFGVAGILIASSINILSMNYVGVANLLFKEYFKTGCKEFFMNRIIYTIIAAAISGISFYVCNLLSFEGIVGIIIRLAVCTLILLLTMPSVMYLIKRKYTKEAIAFIKQIIKA